MTDAFRMQQAISRQVIINNYGRTIRLITPALNRPLKELHYSGLALEALHDA